MQSKNKKYKALMLDLDGTTIPNRRSGMPSKKVVDAVKKAMKKLHVSVVTGRPFFEAENVIRELGLSGISITTGGAEIRDVKTRELLWSKPISKKTTDKILDFFRSKNVEIIISDLDYYENFKIYDPRHLPNKPLLISIPDLPLELGESFVSEMDHFKDIAVNRTVGWVQDTCWLAITNGEGSKQHGIWEAAKILNIETHEIIGVGDGYNDFPLLMACGLRVAIGNAVPELKEIADYVAPSVDEDGVADVIEKFVLG